MTTDGAEGDSGNGVFATHGRTFLERILATAVDGIVVIDLAGIVVDFNRAAERLFGVRADDIVGRNVKLLMPEAVAAEHDGYPRHYLETGERKIIGIGREVEARRPDGSLFVADLAVSEVEADGKRYFVGFLRDMTERKAVEAELRRSEERLSEAQRIAHVGSWEWDIASGQLWWSDETYRIFGLTRDTFGGDYETFMSLVHPDDRDDVERRVERALGGDDYDIEHRVVWADGTVHTVHERGKLVFADDGTPVLMRGTCRDVTEQRDAQEALRISENRLQASQQFANIGTWDWNIQTGEIYWSERIAPLFGYAKGELETTYENFLGAVHPDDRQKVVDAVDACVERGDAYDVEHRVVWPNGEVRWLLEKGDVVRDRDGRPLHMLGVVQDVTRAKLAEEALIKARDLADQANRAKSDFLSAMSHELRTPMNAILGFAQVMRMDTRDPLTESQLDNLSHIMKGGEHLLELINEVLELSKVEAGKMSISIAAVDPGPTIDECLNAIDNMAVARGIRVLDRTGVGRRTAVLADPTRLKQVLLNLLSNAVKYNRDGGEVTVSLDAGRGGSARFTIADTGVGIAPEKHAEVFEPFSRLGAETTDIEGTGIGLTIAYELVNAMGGRLDFESVPGEGSTFWFELPVAAAATAEPGSRAACG